MEGGPFIPSIKGEFFFVVLGLCQHNPKKIQSQGQRTGKDKAFLAFAPPPTGGGAKRKPINELMG